MKTFSSPAHITGFFEVLENDDPSKSGSRGGGIVLSDGVNSGAIVKDSDETNVKVFFNGKECSCKTTRSVVKEILKSTCGSFDVEVHHFSRYPMSYGFGISASGAIGAARALNTALDLNLNTGALGSIAHVAEIQNNTGRGDVIAEFSSGLVVRTKEGGPGFGKKKSFSLEGQVVCFIVGKPLPTKSVLLNPSKKILINQIGGKCLNSFLKEPTPERFMELSKRFTLETGLAQKNVRKAVLDLEKIGVTAAMSMLGNSVFTLTNAPDDVTDALDYPNIISEPLKEDSP
jgi:pantoate kinase